MRLSPIERLGSYPGSTAESYQAFNAITDAGERLPRLAIDTRDYQIIGPGGRVYSRFGGRMADIIFAGYLQAKQGGYGHEAARRYLEYQEALEVEDLCAGKLGGNLMIKISPLPDTVVSGVHGTAGYERDVALVRLYFADPGGGKLRTRCLSLEGSRQAAIRQAAGRLGWLIGPGGSETILASRLVLSLDEPHWQAPGELLKTAYCQALGQQDLGRLALSRSFGQPIDTLSFIRSHPDLLQLYLDDVAAIDRSAADPAGLAGQKELAMRRYAAALDARLLKLGPGDNRQQADRQGGEGYSSGYGGSCSILTGTDQAKQNGLLMGELNDVTCPLCGRSGVTASLEGSVLICSECGNGVDICTKEVRRRSGPSAAPAAAKPARSVNRPSAATVRSGSARPRARRVIELGGEYWLAYETPESAPIRLNRPPL